MTPVLLLLLFLSMTAVPLSAQSDSGNEIDESTSASEIISKANADIKTHLMYDDIAPSRSRNAVPCTASGCKWPKEGGYVYVPITISPSYSTSERNIIIDGLLSFHRSTCIRFHWRNPGHRDYLNFFSGTGCWSYLGRQGGPQDVSLRSNGCLYRSTVQHEVLHALGFHHEQVRSDRDQNVQILTKNILPGAEHNFVKANTNNLGTPYDFNSVMHYSRLAFSRNGQPTIVAKSNPNLSFGNAREMSANDIARVNRLYGC
ncbi:high choriolytic enzyme 1-like [Odontesthes bonariensis]|uniref:high choriolytic enzyme 1-like n=1 Tax=Odontesthes bonariensis TaxID=219752 RepID=UPI003F583B4C